MLGSLEEHPSRRRCHRRASASSIENPRYGVEGRVDKARSRKRVIYRKRAGVRWGPSGWVQLLETLALEEDVICFFFVFLFRKSSKKLVVQVIETRAHDE